VRTEGVVLDMSDLAALLKEKFPNLPMDLQIIRIETDGLCSNRVAFIGTSERFRECQTMNNFFVTHAAAWQELEHR
jgi:hypothetical protein